MQAKTTINPEIFGERLRISRSQAGLTQVQVAEHMHKGAATISDWEKGKSQPSLEEIGMLAKLLKVDAGRLAFGFAEVSPPSTAGRESDKRGTVAEDPSIYGSSPALGREIRELVDELIAAAEGDVGRLGWIREQVLRHLQAPEHWGLHEAARTEVRERTPRPPQRPPREQDRAG